MSEWRPIETAPVGKSILIYGSGGVLFGYMDLHGNWRARHHGPIKSEPSHWMPLPEPPNKVEDDERHAISAGMEMKVLRIESALAALNAHTAAKGNAEELAVSEDRSHVDDLLVDLMHYCAQSEIDFDIHLSIARGYFKAETEDAE